MAQRPGFGIKCRPTSIRFSNPLNNYILSPKPPLTLRLVQKTLRTLTIVFFYANLHKCLCRGNECLPRVMLGPVLTPPLLLVSPLFVYAITNLLSLLFLCHGVCCSDVLKAKFAYHVMITILYATTWHPKRARGRRGEDKIVFLTQGEFEHCYHRG